MHFRIISALPDLIDGWLHSGVLGRAVSNGLIQCQAVNLRDFGKGNYRAIDDAAYGGGPGMVLQAPPLLAALESLREQLPHARIHFMAPEGQRFTTHHIPQWQTNDTHIIVCGRYEGVDERFIQLVQPELWSLGDVVLSGGELAAMSIIDAIARTIPGVLNNSASAEQDSFSYDNRLLDYPHYTRPQKCGHYNVPRVLTQGNHQTIAAWRHGQQSVKTWEWRPDLLRGQLNHCDCQQVRDHYTAKLAAYFANKEHHSTK